MTPRREHPERPSRLLQNRPQAPAAMVGRQDQPEMGACLGLRPLPWGPLCPAPPPFPRFLPHAPFPSLHTLTPPTPIQQNLKKKQQPRAPRVTWKIPARGSRFFRPGSPPQRHSRALEAGRPSTGESRCGAGGPSSGVYTSPPAPTPHPCFCLRREGLLMHSCPGGVCPPPRPGVDSRASLGRPSSGLERLLTRQPPHWAPSPPQAGRPPAGGWSPSPLPFLLGARKSQQRPSSEAEWGLSCPV